MEKIKFSVPRKLFYSAGTAGFTLLEMLIVTYLAYYTLPPPETNLPQLIPETLFGLLPLLGIIVLFGRVLDSITDPIIANLSDSAKFKMGRRIPFMLASTLPLVLSAVFLFHPMYNTKSAWNSLYLMILLSLYFISYTAYVIPYSGLLPEVTRTVRERLNLSMTQGIFGVIGIALGLIVFPGLADNINYASVIGLFGLVAAIFLVMPILVIDERKHCISKPSSFGLHEAIKAAIGNKPFALYLLGYTSYRLGFTMMIIAVPYYVKVLLSEAHAAQSVYFGFAFLTCLLGFAGANILGKRYGKKNTLLCAMAMAVIFMPLLAFLGRIDWGDVNVEFVMKGLGEADIFALVLMGILGIPMASLYVIPNAIVADLTDLEKIRSGQNLEAVYYGVQGFFTKFVIGISFVIVTGLFALFGRGPSPDDPAGSDLGIRLSGPFAAACILLGFMFMRKYPEDLVLMEAGRERKKRRLFFWRRGKSTI